MPNFREFAENLADFGADSGEVGGREAMHGKIYAALSRSGHSQPELPACTAFVARFSREARTGVFSGRVELSLQPARILRVMAMCAMSAAMSLYGCATASQRNAIAQQREALDTSLQTEIRAGRVKTEQLEDGIRVSMTNDLLYVPGSVDLGPKGRVTLGRLAARLVTLAAHGYDIDVVSNTDDGPIEPKLAARYADNWAFAGARAAVVVRFLQEQGVNPGSLEAISAGQYHPVAPNDTVAGRARNRRTDLLLQVR